jgi:DNA-binding NarL/FixJ family response regulator
VPRIRVAAVNDYEIVIQGLASMLSGFDDRIEVAAAITVGEPIVGGVIDVALFDTYGRRGLGVEAIRLLAKDPKVRRVAVFTSPVTDELADEAVGAGAAAVLAKSIRIEELVRDLERVARGESVIHRGSAATAPLSNAQRRTWPGRGRGLTERESSVAVLMAQGMTNTEIASSLYVSVNTVKTHVRRVLEKLGAPNRTKATAIILADESFRHA